MAGGKPRRWTRSMFMKRILAVATLLLFGSAASAQTLDDLRNDGKNTDNVLTYGMGYNQNRFSGLKEINKATIKRLVPVWNLSLANEWGEQAQPLVHNGVMYVTNARATVAIDLASGKQLWRTPVDWLPETPRVVCCGVSNKGAALLNGKLFRTTLDAYVVALDMKTGKEIWKSKAAEWKDGYSMTVAPQIANGVLITGISGAEFGIRGFIDGWDPETGKQLWRRYTIPARGEKGNETWPQDTKAWEVGGGSSWITGSYDPELDLTYWGVGNPAPWASQSRPGDNLYTSSVLALRPKPSTTGGKNWPHAAFNPRTGLLYANTIHQSRKYKHLTTQEYVAGQRYTFVENLPVAKQPGEPHGHMEAINPLTAEKKWRVPLTDFQIWTAMLATDGGLVFTGKTTGEFIALDADTGQQLWQFQTGSGINAQPITFTHNGRQYVSVLSGL